MIELSTHPAISEIGADAWNALVAAEDPPFLRYEFLHILEVTGAASAERGWAPMHLAFREAGELVAVAPAYVKGHSQGEFVFDHGIAEFAEHRLKLAYYPKLVVAAPFTPATGARLLCPRPERRGQLYAALAAGLARLLDTFELSSAHVLFSDAEEAAALRAAGLAQRLGVQLHWHNDGYARFDDFLAAQTSKRRHQMRRERRAMEAQGLRLETRLGSELDASLVNHVFECYRNTIERYFWGRQYLSREFFHAIVAAMPQQVLTVIAYEADAQRPVAAAFNLLGKSAMYGRYWGALAEYDCLHFNVCYYHGIQESIERGLARFEPGAGGEHKRARGFSPVRTYSAHLFADPRLDAVARDFFEREAHSIEGALSET
ncbi:MAG: GNAT family N-acetyltransferase [Polyangiaceae bacterium]